MKKSSRAAVVLLTFLLLFAPVQAFGAEPAVLPETFQVIADEVIADEVIADEEETLAGEEKAVVAGEMLSAIIHLIMNHYAGEETTPEELYESAVKGMMTDLDMYSAYYSPEDLSQFEKSLSGNVYGIGVCLELNADGCPVIVSVIKDSPAFRAGLKKGERVLCVNGADVKDSSLDQIIALILESGDGRVTLTVQDSGASHDVSVTKEKIKLASVYTEKFENLLEKAKSRDNADLRYIYISAVGEDTANEFGQTLLELQRNNVSRVALDLRGNPGGYLDVIIKLSNMIVPKGPILFTVDKDGNRTAIRSTLATPPFQKIVVITDNDTASAAEVLASALQDSQAAVVVGEKTFGKGVIQSLYKLPVGGAIKFTTEKYLRRNGTEINEVGVTPDYIIAVSTNEDKPLEKAFELLID